VTIPTGDRRQIEFTNTEPEPPVPVEPVEPEPFVAPIDANNESMQLRMNGGCWRAGHSDGLEKCVVQCPIQSIGHIGSGSNQPMTFTSVEPPEVQPFVPPTDDSGNPLELTIAGACGTQIRNDECVVHCPIAPTIVVRFGTSSPLKFTSVLPELVPFDMPVDSTGQELQLVLKSEGCVESTGHTAAWGKYTVKCQVEQTVSISSQHRGSLKFSNPVTGNATIASVLHWAHNGNSLFFWPENTAEEINEMFPEGSEMVPGYFHSAPGGEEIDVSRVLHYAWDSNRIYFYPDGHTPATCAQAATEMSMKFPSGYGVSVSNRRAVPVHAGQTFDVTGTMLWAWQGTSVFFYPDGDYDYSVESCGQAASDFSDMFPTTYGIEVSNRAAIPTDAPTPTPVPLNQTFNVDSIMHWSWNGNGLYFFPAQSDLATCDDVATEINTKFPEGYGIDVSYRRGDTPISAEQDIIASEGVLHYAWRGSTLFFRPDEDVSVINSKIAKGYRLEVSYTDAVDYHQLKVSPEAASCWKPGSELLLTSHTRWDDDRQVATIVASDPETGMITLDRPVKKPITLADDPTFAVEVAPLNRRVVFEADSDPSDAAIGGHLIVHHTASAQHLEGVEIKNFGQQGRLGRYPVHFHACGDHPNSIVKKNVV
jgi:hypothetical protein